MNQFKESNFVLSPVPFGTMIEEFGALVSEKIAAALSEAKKKEDYETFISADAARKMFTPSITFNTLKSWTREGLLKDYRFGRRIFYKKGEIIEAGKTLRKYGRRALS